jgi:hypothetical protein
MNLRHKALKRMGTRLVKPGKHIEVRQLGLGKVIYVRLANKKRNIFINYKESKVTINL